MSDANAQEPTMEEILASIRRIISEDDAPAAAEPEAPRAEEAPKAAAARVEAAAEEEEDDVLELTNPEPSPSIAEALGDIEVSAREPEVDPDSDFGAAAEAPFAGFAASAFDDEAEEDDGLTSPPVASLAASAFGQLSRTIAMPAEGRTLEDVVRELLRPLLKDWLDTHLPGIVETAVQAEVERISRRGV
jgi:cell pole-organizing protein PopZ